MRLFVPPLGTKLKLSEDFGFDLYREHRNYASWDMLTCEAYNASMVVRPREPAHAFLPKDTVLSVERIYIRQGNKDFDSITFRIWGTNTKGKFQSRGRFWVKLADANKMEVEIQDV